MLKFHIERNGETFEVEVSCWNEGDSYYETKFRVEEVYRTDGKDFDGVLTPDELENIETNHNEDAYERSLSDYYGGSCSPEVYGVCPSKERGHG